MVCKNNVTLGLTAIYKSPAIQIELFLECLEIYLNDQILHICDTEIFCGDINIDLLDTNSLSVGNYINLLSEKGFNCIINQATRISGNSASCIDHFFVKHDEYCKVLGVILNHGFTDHLPILLNMKMRIKKEQLNANKCIERLDFRKVNMILEREQWLEILKCQDVNDCTAVFLERLRFIIDSATERTYTVCSKRRIKPWITLGLLASVRQRDKLKRMSSKDPNNVAALNRFKDYRKSLTKLINKTKTDYYRKLFEYSKNDSKKTWSLVKSASNNRRSFQRIGVISNDKGMDILDEKQKANAFNIFFSSIGEKLANKIASPTTNIEPPIPKGCGSIFLAPIRNSELIQIINSLKNSSSTGEDKIGIDFLKRYHSCILKPLSYLVNLIFRNGFFPDVLKKCVITPVHKGGSRKEITNYRPIAITSNLSKIIEKCIKLRIEDYLWKNKILSDAQYGFRQSLSTEDAIIRVVNHVYKSLDQGSKSLSVFLDLAKAFDTVSLPRLLEKIELIGIRGIPYNLIKSYLIGRTQRVRVGDSLSSSLSVNYGVPQGTVLGPLLFTIYIDDLLALLPKESMVCYADDTVILLRNKTWNQVFRDAELAMRKVKLWLDLNLLTLNVDKSKYIPFSFDKRTSPENLTLKIHEHGCTDLDTCDCNKEIYEVSNIKYLGVYLDSHMRWDYHVQYITGKIRKMYYKLYQIKQWLPKKFLVNIYKALVESVMSYGLVVWGSVCDSVAASLMIAQKRILKIILSRPRRFSSKQLFREAGVLSLKQLYIKSVARIILNNKYNVNKIDHCIHTRSISLNNAYVPTSFFTTIQRSLSFSAPRIYNLLPTEFKNKRYKLVKNKITRWLLDGKIESY